MVFLLISLSIFAGICIKYLDVLYYKRRKVIGVVLLTIASSLLISYLVFIFPDIMMGIIFGVVLMGKTNNKYQMFNFLIPFAVFIYKYIDGFAISFPLLLYTTFLSVLDESRFNLNRNRPWVPLGLLALLIISEILQTDQTFIYYIGLSTVSLLCFDVGYKLTTLLCKKGRC